MVCLGLCLGQFGVCLGLFGFEKYQCLAIVGDLVCLGSSFGFRFGFALRPVAWDWGLFQI